MKKLEDTFTRKKVIYTKVFENDDWYIYRCDDRHEYSNGIYFEVFKKRVHRETIHTDKGWEVTDEMVEYYPGSEEFGTYSAYCCNTLERAMRYVSGELPKK